MAPPSHTLDQEMLLTEYGFEERALTHQGTVQRFQAWRHVGISTESICFLIDRGADGPDLVTRARAQLCASGAELLDLLDRLSNANPQVYWLDFSAESEEYCRLSSVVALYRYTIAGVKCFDFLSEDGVVRSCSVEQPAPTENCGWTMVWASW